MSDLVLNKLTSKSKEILNQSIEECLIIAHTENLKVREKILDDILLQPDEAHIRVLIHFHQKRLIFLANELYNSLNINESAFYEDKKYSKFEEIMNIVLCIIEDLIFFLLEDFNEYFNLEEKPSKTFILEYSKNLTEKISDIQSLSEDPNKFMNLIVTSICNFINNPEKSIFRTILLYQQLVDEILSFKNQMEEPDLSRFICIKLISLNFNTLSFFNLVTSEINSATKHLIPSAKLEKLYLFRKEINQIPLMQKLCHNTKLKSIKELLSDWISEEINHLETNTLRSTKNKTEKADFKIPVNLSVSQLGFLLKCFVAIGMIKLGKSDAKPLTRLFALNTITIGAIEISAESLRQHFYKADEKTKKAIKELIIKILNYIQSLNCLTILLNILQG